MIPICTFAFEAIGFSIVFPSVGQVVAYAALTSLAVWGGTEASKLLSDVNIVHNEAIDQGNKEENEKRKKPPFDGKNLGNDPSKCPEEGFEWKGRGSPGNKGTWVRPKTNEKLYPDLDHPPPKKPHWDYVGPDYPEGVRLNTDGTWEKKNEKASIRI